jgi:hypothetical protein
MMFDILGKKLNPGDKVYLIKSDYKNLAGKIYTVMQHDILDSPNKVKISISDQWQGYYNFNEVIKVEK